MTGFVDVHSHVIPSGDDGARSVEAGLALCMEAGRRGTRVLYGTPHVWPSLPLTPERERAVRAAHAEMAPLLAGHEYQADAGLVVPLPRGRVPSRLRGCRLIG